MMSVRFLEDKYIDNKDHVVHSVTLSENLQVDTASPDNPSSGFPTGLDIRMPTQKLKLTRFLKFRI